MPVKSTMLINVAFNFTYKFSLEMFLPLLLLYILFADFCCGLLDYLFDTLFKILCIP